jgi:hypothetical protein
VQPIDCSLSSCCYASTPPAVDVILKDLARPAFARGAVGNVLEKRTADLDLVELKAPLQGQKILIASTLGLFQQDRIN